MLQKSRSSTPLGFSSSSGMDLSGFGTVTSSGTTVSRAGVVFLDCLICGRPVSATSVHPCSLAHIPVHVRSPRTATLRISLPASVSRARHAGAHPVQRPRAVCSAPSFRHSRRLARVIVRRWMVMRAMMRGVRRGGVWVGAGNGMGVRARLGRRVDGRFRCMGARVVSPPVPYLQPMRS